jgi:hypothetical protein
VKSSPKIYAERVEDLPFDVSAGVVCEVADEGGGSRLWIFDGFKWATEGLVPGEFVYYSAPESEGDPDFKHCPKCVGVQVITTLPPKVMYQCEVCGGGVEPLEMINGEPGPAGPPVAQDDSVCLEAHRLINGERQAHYGSQYVNFGDIADLWSAYLDKPVSRNDVANLMILLKIARTKRQGYHRDSYTDVAGYAGCAEKVHQREQTMAAVGMRAVATEE